MVLQLTAIYRNGAFVPDRPCDLPNGSKVNLQVYSPNVTPPLVTDPEERKRIIERLFRMMDENPIPADAPKLTREEMHERR